MGWSGRARSQTKSKAPGPAEKAEDERTSVPSEGVPADEKIGRSKYLRRAAMGGRPRVFEEGSAACRRARLKEERAYNRVTIEGESRPRTNASKREIRICSPGRPSCEEVRKKETEGKKRRQ